MDIVQIVLTCPNCGNSTWETTDNCEFKCLKCGEAVSSEAMCSATKDADETDWFGEVRWCEEDLEAALEEQGYPVTKHNIEKLRKICESHWFTDHMIEAGWEYIYDHIGYGTDWDE